MGATVHAMPVVGDVPGVPLEGGRALTAVTGGSGSEVDGDQELLARIHAGDGESFGTLYDRTREWLMTFVIVPRVGRADAEDVLAETYHVALEKIHSFRWRGIGLLHWLATIARRKAQEHGRGTRAGAQRLDELQDLLEIAADVPTAEAELLRVEHVERIKTDVDEVLCEVPPRYAEVLRLRLLEGWPRPQCAASLGVSLATFDVLLYRATRAFAREWRKHAQS
jgi:RNA polymerase sigma factor (sigma-70 family)